MTPDTLTLTRGATTLTVDLAGRFNTGTADYICLDTTGLRGAADVNADDQQSTYGEIGGSDPPGGRPLNVDVLMRSTDGATATQKGEILEAFLRSSALDLELAWMEDGLERCYWVRSRSVGRPDSDAVMPCRFRAIYPARFGPQSTAHVAKGGTTAGAAGGLSPTIHWSCTIVGPATVPVIEYTALGGVQVFQVLQSIPSGSTLEVLARGPEGYSTSRLIDGDGVKGVSLAVSLYDLDPGARSFGFDADTGGTAGADFYWRNNLS